MPDLVADIGNTRLKYGVCEPTGITAIGTLDPKDEESWILDIPSPRSWTLAGSDPDMRDRFAEWLRSRGDDVAVISDCRRIPIDLAVESPEMVGHDRLLNALAATRRNAGGNAVVISAGTAVTVDLVDGGVFRGGAIFPGLNLMARSLHENTARLPLVEIVPPFRYPGTHTEEAIRTGILFSVCGGIERFIAGLPKASIGKIFLTGGDAELIAHHLYMTPDIVDPHLTLEGIRLLSTFPHKKGKGFT